MAKIKYINAKLYQGILQNASGSIGDIVVQKNCRIRIKKMESKRKSSRKS